MILKVAVIGVGAMGRNHARVYADMPGADLVAVSDTDENVAQGIARRDGGVSYLDYRDLLDKEKPEKSASTSK